VFLAPKPRQPGTPPTLGQVKDAFPLPGHYHFRFKAPLTPGGDREKGGMAVWMDIVEDRQPVPTYNNGIVAKVTRISMEEEDDDDDDDDHHHHHNLGSAAAPPASQQRHQQPMPHHTQPAPAAPIPSAPLSHGLSMSSTGSGASADHLDLFGGSSPAPPTNVGGGDSLLDFDSHVPAPAPSAVHVDFFGMTTPASGGVMAPPPAPVSGGYGGNPNMYHQQQQQQHFNSFPPQGGQQQQQQQQQNSQGAFGGLGTPWHS
jgi:hypothetical protein